jgi:hypothetical protein
MRIIKIILKVILVLFISTVLIMLLWNWLIPDIFKGPQITLIQAAGLLLLSKLMFSGIGRGFGRHPGGHRRYYDWKKCREKTSEKEKENKS